MKIFISWSGNKSQEVAKVLKQWIPCVIQSAEPYFSSADIDKGARWSTDIAKELQDASFGILCVTKDNLSSSWLNFEAGALSKSIDQSKVCPFLVDLKPSDIQDSPILQFQMTSATKEDVFKLFKSINSNLGEAKLNEDILSTTYDTFWPKIEEALSTAAASEPTPARKQNPKAEQASIEEILELVRYQYRLLRSPEDLLPASYLSTVVAQATRSMLPRDLAMEIDEQLHIIDMLAADALGSCDSPKAAEDTSACISQLREIRERTKKLATYIRRRVRMPSLNSSLNF